VDVLTFSILIAIMTAILRYRRHDAMGCAYKPSLLCNNNFYRESFTAASFLSQLGSNDVFARVSRLSGLRGEPFVIENPWHRNSSRTRTNHHRPSVSVAQWLR